MVERVRQAGRTDRGDPRARGRAHRPRRVNGRPTAVDLDLVFHWLNGIPGITASVSCVPGSGVSPQP